MIKERVFAPSVLGPDLWAEIQAQHGPYLSDGRAGAHLVGFRQALNLGGAEPAGKVLGDCARHGWGRRDCQAGPRETSWQARGLGHGQHRLTLTDPLVNKQQERETLEATSALEKALQTKLSF